MAPSSLPIQAYVQHRLDDDDEKPDTKQDCNFSDICPHHGHCTSLALISLFNLNIFSIAFSSLTDYCCLAKEIESKLQAGKINKKGSSENKGKN